MNKCVNKLRRHLDRKVSTLFSKKQVTNIKKECCRQRTSDQNRTRLRMRVYVQIEHENFITASARMYFLLAFKRCCEVFCDFYKAAIICMQYVKAPLSVGFHTSDWFHLVSGKSLNQMICRLSIKLLVRERHVLTSSQVPSGREVHAPSSKSTSKELVMIGK
jgi:hypothetical protein